MVLAVQLNILDPFIIPTSPIQKFNSFFKLFEDMSHNKRQSGSHSVIKMSDNISEWVYG